MPDNKLLAIVAIVMFFGSPSEILVAAEYELAPNPNPGTNTITITSADIANNNSEPFENFGAIVVQNGGVLNNVTEMDILFDEDGGSGGLSTVSVEFGGVLNALTGSKMNFDSVSKFNVSGTVNNLGDISSDWSMQLAVGSQFNNAGIFNNKQGATNRGSFVNSGSFSNSTPAFDTGGFFQQIGDFQNQASATMVNQGELLNFTTITNYGSVTNTVFGSGGIGRGIFRNMGTLHNEQTGTVTNRHRWFNTGTLNNAGLFVNHAAGLGIGNSAGAAIQNLTGGTFQNDRTINNFSSITNAGQFLAGNIAGTGTYQQTDGETVVDGILEASAIDFLAGTVSGQGTLTGPVLIADGAMAMPGSNAVGQLSVEGDLNLDGQYQVQIQTPGQVDLLDVTGDLIVGPNGSLDVSFVNGYVPIAGHSFDVLIAENISGEFASVTQPANHFSVDVLIDAVGTRDVVRLSFTDAIECDFDADGVCNVIDLDALLSVGPIAGGVPAAATPQFDLTGDGLIDLADLDAWLAAAATDHGLGSPYKPSDANLDGVVDASDFNIWNDNKFTGTTQWSEGDFNGDGAVDASDFNTWNENKYTSSSTTLVPEPATVWQVLVLTLLYRKRRRLPSGE